VVLAAREKNSIVVNAAERRLPRRPKQKRAARRRAEVHDGTWNVGHSSVKMQMNRLRQEIGGRRVPPLPADAP